MRRVHWKRQVQVMAVLLLMSLMTAGCGAVKPEEAALKVGLVVDGQQITADPFQYLVWEGLEHFRDGYDEAEIKYLESESEKEYLPNFDQLADEGCDLIIGAGFLLDNAIQEAAALNEKVNYVLLDRTFGNNDLRDNLTGIDFASEIPAFLAGYIAGNVTETNKVGFIGGISSAPIDRFEYGYRYGVKYAASELGKKIQVEVQYTDTFWEQTEGKNAADKMYEDGCDIILQAAGECGQGVIEAAKLKDKWVIGADVDQYEEAPHNILTSVLKYTDKAAEAIAEEFAADKSIGGKNYLYGLGENAVGIPDRNPNLEDYYPGLYEKTMELEEEIRSGGLAVPADKRTFYELSEKL